MKTYDPSMHTAEHILNQTMVRMFQCNRSFSNHLEHKKSKCDYIFSRPLTSEEECLIREKVNSIIARQLPVTKEMISREEAVQGYNLTNLPADAGNSLQIVKIGDYDACPCIGEHVENTSEIGLFVIISSSFENNVLRIRFKLNRP